MSRIFSTLLLFFFLCGSALAQDPVTVFAAASTRNALDQIIELYQGQSDQRIVTSYASSGALARQIEAGAPAGIFLSASIQWVDYLDERNLLAADSRKDLLANALVLIAAADNRQTYAIAEEMPLVTWLGGGRLSIGDPSHVPAGIYAKQALENLKVWDSVVSHTAQVEDVRSAMMLVSRGEAPLGIVYSTDTVVDPGVRVAATFPATTHDPIIYPAAIIKENDSAAVRSFYQFLQTTAALEIFKDFGFVTP